MWKLVFTCEHGGNKIPKEYASLFKGKKELLNSHKGWDPGALILYNKFCSFENDYNLFSETSRLLVELNRSLNNPNLFSELTLKFSEDKIAREKLLANYYFPFRNSVLNKIDSFINSGNNVFHLSVHTFSPVMNNLERKADIGILYDPKNLNEKKFARLWKDEIKKVSSLKVRFNYPYLGTSDGHTSFLRKEFGNKNYAGLELEVNQKFFYQGNSDFLLITKVATESFISAWKIFTHRIN